MEASLEAATAEIDALNAVIESRQARVDRYSQTSVDEFNRLVEQQRRLVQAFNARLPPANERFAQHNRIVDDFNASCAGREYYEDDMQAVLAGQ